jgi:hypothetical protein
MQQQQQNETQDTFVDRAAAASTYMQHLSIFQVVCAPLLHAALSYLPCSAANLPAGTVVHAQNSDLLSASCHSRRQQPIMAMGNIICTPTACAFCSTCSARRRCSTVQRLAQGATPVTTWGVAPGEQPSRRLTTGNDKLAAGQCHSTTRHAAVILKNQQHPVQLLWAWPHLLSAVLQAASTATDHALYGFVCCLPAAVTDRYCTAWCCQ